MYSDNYYVIISRESLYQLPYSVDAVLKLKKTSFRFQVTYNRTYPLYDKLNIFEGKTTADWCFLTEDTNSGFDLFSHIAKMNGSKCVSAGGKSSIIKILEILRTRNISLLLMVLLWGRDGQNI